MKPTDLTVLYGEQASLWKELYRDAAKGFYRTFGEEPRTFYRAPGRVEIGGNHTDHQGGVTLSSAIRTDMIAAVGSRSDGRIILHSEGYAPCEAACLCSKPNEAEKGTTLSLLRGMCAAFSEKGWLPGNGSGGFNAYIKSAVPAGSGLSSSAAMEILIGTILWDLYAPGDPDRLLLAQMAKYTENEYFGKPSGLLDQVSCSYGGIISVDFSGDNPWVRRINTDFSESGLAIYMVSCGAGHEDLTDEYATIPRECCAVAACFGEKRLAEVAESDFMGKLPELRSKLGDRAVLRAMHFYEENRRALSEAFCLQKGNWDGFLRLVNASGKSSAMYLQNVTPSAAVGHQDMLFTLALCENALRGKGAIRVHGGGFGGTVEAFVPLEKEADFVMRVSSVLGEKAVNRIHLCSEGGAKTEL